MMKFSHLFLLGILLQSSCDTTLTGYPFKIEAIYQAPSSKLQITVNAEGQIVAGADIANTYKGTVHIAPLTDVGEKVQLVFVDKKEVIYTSDSRGRSQAKWGLQNSENSLTSILEQSGYLQLDSDELAEIVKVVGGVFAGPKGVTLDGQAKYLKVLSVDYVR